MSFKAYRATPFNHTHENNAFNKLHDFLQNHWGEQDEPLHLIGNFYVDGCEIDALIIKRNAVIVIDFKDYGGNLIFSENGQWKIDGKEVRGGNSTNPYQQIRNNKFQLLNYLKNQIDFQSSPNLGHIAGLCLFHQNIEFDASTLSQNISRWFHITDMSSVMRTTDAIVSYEISFSNADIDLMISKLDVPIYYPDGRPTEAFIPTFEEGVGSETVMLNSEQTKALVAIKDWLADTKNKVFSLAGAFYTGKTKVLESAVNEFVLNGKTPLFLAPNARIANRYKSRGFHDVSSIYSWLYAGRPNDIRNGKEVYPVDREPIDPDKDVIVIFDSHLLGDDLFEMETTVYGSGYTLSDFLSSFAGSDSNALDAQASLELTDLPKILLIGDPYQLTRGARDKSLLGCQIFEQHKVSSIRTELKSQDRDDLAPIEMLDFQSSLIGQIKAMKFVQLPLCQQGSIETIAKDEHTVDSIASSLIKWPRRTAYLCSTNDRAQTANDGIRKKYLGAHSFGLLTEGDIIDIRNRTLNLQVNEFEQSEAEWVSSGQFARVVSSDARIDETKSITLKGRKNPVSVNFARASIEYSGGTAEILYLPDFLSASMPELTQDQTIALQIWAREEADKVLANEKKILESTNKEDDRYKEVLQKYKTRHSNLVMESRYTNAARLRYAYALTVHRAQTYEPLPRVVLDGSSAHDTDNPATDSYFRWLYTATTCTSDALQILDYPELSPLSKARWSFETVRLVPITFKHTFYYQQDRIPTDAELAIPLPNGFSNPEPRLLSLLLTVYELVNDTDWRVESITQHNFRESYFFTSDRGEVTIDLDYNGKYEVSVGKVQLNSGHQDLSYEINGLLVTDPIFKDENIATAVDIFKDHLARKNWAVVSLDEKNYKVFLVAEHNVGKIKIELNVPSDTSISKKGMISSVKVQQADSKVVADQFEADFANG